MKENKNIRKEIEKNLLENSKAEVDEVLQKLETKKEGLDQIEVDERLEDYGKNIIDTANNNRIYKRVKEAIVNPFNIVLIIVAIVIFFTDVVFSATPSYATIIMLLIIVLISGIVSFVQSEKSNNAAKKLQKMISNKIDVIRNGITSEINIEEAVPGDIVKLASGDMIPGDVRFIETKDLFIDQSGLTGESNPIEKFVTSKENKNILELENIGFLGTNIVSRKCKSCYINNRK